MKKGAALLYPDTHYGRSSIRRNITHSERWGQRFAVVDQCYISLCQSFILNSSGQTLQTSAFHRETEFDINSSSSFTWLVYARLTTLVRNRGCCDQNGLACRFNLLGQRQMLPFQVALETNRP